MGGGFIPCRMRCRAAGAGRSQAGGRAAPDWAGVPAMAA